MIKIPVSVIVLPPYTVKICRVNSNKISGMDAEFDMERQECNISTDIVARQTLVATLVHEIDHMINYFCNVRVYLSESEQLGLDTHDFEELIVRSRENMFYAFFKSNKELVRWIMRE